MPEHEHDEYLPPILLSIVDCKQHRSFKVWQAKKLFLFWRRSLRTEDMNKMNKDVQQLQFKTLLLLHWNLFFGK